VNDADRLSLDPVMRQVVGGRAVDAKAASASQMGRFEIEVLATLDNRSALADVSGLWIDRVHDRKPPKWITLDMDSSVTTGSRMTVFPKKSEQKRLNSSAQTGGHQPQIPINPTFENRSSAQVVRQVREPPYCLPQRVDQSAVQRQNAEEGILLGECRLNALGE